MLILAFNLERACVGRPGQPERRQLEAAFCRLLFSIPDQVIDTAFGSRCLGGQRSPDSAHFYLDT